ncbi:hypothetical protein MCHI_000315 [Candidatus Magnetoovum chiemensis]|nr:hypothetical protein MCHI_000315 [Candidatus Magnetoovum chiemensis]
MFAVKSFVFELLFRVESVFSVSLDLDFFELMTFKFRQIEVVFCVFD